MIKKLRSMDVSMKIINQRKQPTSTHTVSSKPTHQPTTRFVPVAPPTTVTTTTSLPSTASGTHSGPMDMSFAGKRRPLTAEEKERRNKLGLCRYCGQPGHIAKDHNDVNTLQAKRRAAGLVAAGLTANPSELDASGKASSSSIVALEDQ